MWENVNPTFLLKFGKILYLKGHSRCKNLQTPKPSKKRKLSNPKGGRCVMKRSFLAKNCWIGFLQLYSVQKQIVGSNLGLPATHTRGCEVPFHELTQLSALNSCILIQYGRYKGNKWIGIVPLYSVVINGCSYYVPRAIVGSEIEKRSMKQDPSALIDNRLTEGIELSLTDKLVIQ